MNQKREKIYAVHTNQFMGKTFKSIITLSLMNTDFKCMKNSLLAACIEKQQLMMQTARQAMLDMKESALEGRSSEEMSDAFAAQCQNEHNMYARRLHEASGILTILERVKGVKSGKSVGFGSLVITGSQHFFVAAGIGEFTLEEASFFIISAQTPIFKAMEGKTVGEAFEFRGRSYLIQAII